MGSHDAVPAAIRRLAATRFAALECGADYVGVFVAAWAGYPCAVPDLRWPQIPARLEDRRAAAGVNAPGPLSSRYSAR